MSALKPIKSIESLKAEWQRIAILCQCLLDARAGKQPSEAVIRQLRDCQQQVDFLRQGHYWSTLLEQTLPPLAIDLLVCAYGPQIHPDIALSFQDLQQHNSAQPTLAFIHRLLALDEQQYQQAQQLLNDTLTSTGLLMTKGHGPMTQLHTNPQWLSTLTAQSAVTHIDTSLSTPINIQGATLINSDENWDDLVLGAPQITALKEYLSWIRHSQQVVDQWQGKKPSGPIALFSGPSGTGKTFAASVIANDVGWSLYRVDLGALVSKYIGETEKNLNKLFDAVKGRKILLQFDEVDALMGKRGEIKDARDRYANMEVSHLLSRIEQHQGPCILTTNLRKHIDLAFQRRFHFVVAFSKPGPVERLLLWQKLLPKDAPFAEDLDLTLVAEAVALAGGEIRNAAMHAAVMAMSQSTNIDMSHIASGVWRVLQKGDNHTRLEQLRQLSEFLPRHIISGEAQ